MTSKSHMLKLEIIFKGNDAMDKRTILFVVSLSLTLFLVNLFFQYQNIDQRQEWLSQQAARETQKEKYRKEEISQRTAPLSSLPLVQLYEYPESDKPLAYGVLNHESILALAWTTSLPKTIFIKSPKSDEFQTYHLSYQEQRIQLGSPLSIKHKQKIA